MIFAAIKGNQHDGIKYTKDLIKLGINTFLCEKEQTKNIDNKNINLLISKNVILALAKISKKFYPKQPKNITAITGTNGKTSVAHYINYILMKNNLSPASIGTLGIKMRKNIKISNLTTPDPVTGRRIFPS